LLIRAGIAQLERITLGSSHNCVGRLHGTLLLRQRIDAEIDMEITTPFGQCFSGLGIERGSE
jgi:hypothetical protein